MLIKPIFSQFIQQVSVSKHVYDARAWVDDEEELKSLVALFSGNHGSSCIAADINNLYPPLVSRKEKWEFLSFPNPSSFSVQWDKDVNCLWTVLLLLRL